MVMVGTARGHIFLDSHDDFKLIGYDSIYKSNYFYNESTFDEISINFLTKKKLIKEAIKVSPSGKHVNKESWKKIDIKQLTKLSEIKDFDTLDMSIY